MKQSPFQHDSSPRIGIIGGGLSGLVCASVLHRNGIECTVHDRGRRVGGRISSRSVNIDGLEVHFDHGAPAIDGTNEQFRAFADSSIIRDASTTYHVRGQGDMQSIAAGLSTSLDVHCSCEVQRLERQSTSWNLTAQNYDGTERQSTFDWIIFACPVEQARRVLGVSKLRMPVELEAIYSIPAWACLLAFDSEERLPEPPTRTSPVGSELIASVEWQRRYGTLVTAVARMTGDAAELHRNTEREQVGAMMSAEVCRLLAEELGVHDPETMLRHTSVHRWGLARPANPVFLSHYLDPGLRIGYVGDQFTGVQGLWCGGEAAILSGLAGANGLLNDLMHDS